MFLTQKVIFQFLMVIFTTLFWHSSALCKSTLKMAMLFWHCPTLFNIHVHNVVSTLTWHARCYDIISTYEQRWNKVEMFAGYILKILLYTQLFIEINHNKCYKNIRQKNKPYKNALFYFCQLQLISFTFNLYKYIYYIYIYIYIYIHIQNTNNDWQTQSLDSMIF